MHFDSKAWKLLILLLIVQGCSLEDIADCASLLTEYATSSAEFMQCSITYARPIAMCQECQWSYNAVVKGHTKILELSDSNNRTCKERLINLDRLEIIEAGYSYVTQLWRKGNCDNCYEAGTIDTLSNYTLTFRNLYNSTDYCVNEYYQEDNKTYDPAVCTNCSKFYFELNKFYDHLKAVSGDGNLCIDIVDAMNITQNRWSGTLHCGKNAMIPEIALIASFATILTLPVLFYLSVWMLSSSAPSPVSMQKRLRTRIMDSIRNRTGSMISQFRH